jgi:hypothetical protein
MVLSSGSDADVAHRRLELDERMGLVVFIGRVGLAAGTEVEIMADSTLVTSAANIRGPAAGGLAHGAVAADAHMNRLRCEARIWGIGKGLVDRGEAVARVDKAGIHYTVSAVVPIRALEALVADASNVLIQCVSDNPRRLVGGALSLTLSQPSQIARWALFLPGASLILM